MVVPFKFSQVQKSKKPLVDHNKVTQRRKSIRPDSGYYINGLNTLKKSLPMKFV